MNVAINIFMVTCLFIAFYIVKLNYISGPGSEIILLMLIMTVLGNFISLVYIIKKLEYSDSAMKIAFGIFATASLIVGLIIKYEDFISAPMYYSIISPAIYLGFAALAYIIKNYENLEYRHPKKYLAVKIILGIAGIVLGIIYYTIVIIVAFFVFMAILGTLFGDNKK